MFFDPKQLRPYVDEWPLVARGLLNYLQRKALRSPNDRSLPELVRELCEYPDVPADWRQPSFDQPLPPALELSLRKDGTRARFLTTLTVFNGALDVTLEELQLESFFPLDTATEALFA